MNRDQDIKFFKPTNLEENARKPEGRTKKSNFESQRIKRRMKSLWNKITQFCTKRYTGGWQKQVSNNNCSIS